MSYDSYLVRLDPQDDNGYAYIYKFGVLKGHKLLTPAEGDALRGLLLDNDKKELGKTVGLNGVNGEGYNVLNTFPKMNELHRFFRSVASEEFTGDQFYSMNAKKKADAKAAAVSKAEGGYRRRSLRKSSKRTQLKKSRASKLR